MPITATAAANVTDVKALNGEIAGTERIISSRM
jgi:hypothetical protein